MCHRTIDKFPRKRFQVNNNIFDVIFSIMSVYPESLRCNFSTSHILTVEMLHSFTLLFNKQKLESIKHI